MSVSQRESAPITTVEQPPRNAARAAGIAYLISFALIAYVEFGVHQRLIKGDPIIGTVDAAETASNILAHQSLWRLSIALDLSYGAAVAIVLAAFYVILRPYGPTIALVAAASRVVWAVAFVVSAAQLFETLRVLTDLPGFSGDQAQALASSTLTIRWDYYYVGLLFWGLSTSLFSYLWLTSRYIPRWLAVVGMACGALATVCGFIFIADPDFANTVNAGWFDSPLGVFEIVLSVLLLVRPPRHAQP